MHVETYPAFLTPRDKEPSLSSFEKKSLENVWLARKQTEKTRIYKKNRASALFVDSIYDISIYFFMMDLLEQASPRVPQESPFLVFTREFI